MPACDTSISWHEELCKNCGTTLARASGTSPEAVQPEVVVEKPYESKFSVVGRLWRLLVSPSEAMQDVALVPNYGGVSALLCCGLLLLYSLFGWFCRKFILWVTRGSWLLFGVS